MSDLVCWVCEEFGKCPYPICYAQEKVSKPLAEDWEEELEINEEQLRFDFDGSGED